MTARSPRVRARLPWLLGGASALLMAAGPAAAQEARETNRYSMQVMVETFDGARGYSHTQTIGYGRMRQGQESWIELDFGDGAAVIESPRGLAASGFTNTSGTEAGLRYDYATHRLHGGSPLVSGFHNTFVRRQLGRAPALGSDASWTAQLTLAELGFVGRAPGEVSIELSRRYFEHGGRPYVLLRYRVPTFSYTFKGRRFVQWGEGLALTDPGFGTMYWNAALHRAVGAQDAGSGRPYRFAKTMIALDAEGQPMVDPRAIPETAGLVDTFYGPSAREVMGFVEGGDRDLGPLVLANSVDIMALSIAEDSANQLGEVTGQYLNGQNGNVFADPLPAVHTGPAAQDAADALGAQAFGTEPAMVPSPQSQTLADEAAHVVQERSSVTAPSAAPATTTTSSDGASPGGGGVGAGGGTGQGGGGGGGQSSASVSAQNVLDGAITTVGQVSGATTDTVNTADQVADTLGGLTELMLRAEQVHDDLLIARREFEEAKAALEALPQSEAITTTIKQSTLALKSELTAMNLELAQYEEIFSASERTGVKPHPALITEFIKLKGQAMDASSKLQGLYASGEAWDYRVSDKAKSLHGVMAGKASTIKTMESSLETLGGQAYVVARKVQLLDPGAAARFTRRILESPYAEKLGKFADFLNGLDIAKATYNMGSVFSGNTGGELPLSRDYGDGSTKWLALELASLWGNIASGNLAGFALDAATTMTTSLSDILIANYGLTKTFEAMDDAEWTRLRLETDQRIRRIDDAVDALETELAEAEEELDTFDEDVEEGRKLAEELLEERRRNREEAERLAREAEEAAAEEARRAAEAEELAEAQRTEPTPEEWEQFHEDIAEAIKPDYPTVPPLTEEEARRIDQERQERLERERELALAEAEREAAEMAAELARQAAEREAQIQRSIEEAEAAIARREEERLLREQRLQEARERELTVSELETSDLVVSEFDVTPVVFDPPTWDPPVFEPPVWVPPEFDPPEPTPIEWTDFDEGDDYPNTGNLAFGFEDMSGTVETDLSRWAEWLATQNVRELERLALLAGYPNLASALADAENLIRLSQDDGYRQWALQAPSCGGYVGCGPSYLERWWMKSAVVKLGEILNDSRAIFSTGGLSDVSITGLNLAYLMRDFGTQDGDQVNIVISQFGREIYNRDLTLTNAGEDFDIQLRAGVAALSIYAINEGSISPNTAEIQLDNVTRGDAVQSYSLNTGQTATLRIATNGQGN